MYRISISYVTSTPAKRQIVAPDGSVVAAAPNI